MENTQQNLESVVGGSVPAGPGCAPGLAWRLEGDLTVYTAGEARRQLLERLAAPGGLALDLGGVAGCDTAGLQLLCAARLSAQRAGRGYEVTACAPSVRAAAQAIGLSDAAYLDPLSPASV